MARIVDFVEAVAPEDDWWAYVVDPNGAPITNVDRKISWENVKERLGASIHEFSTDITISDQYEGMQRMYVNTDSVYHTISFGSNLVVVPADDFVKLIYVNSEWHYYQPPLKSNLTIDVGSGMSDDEWQDVIDGISRVSSNSSITFSISADRILTRDIIIKNFPYAVVLKTDTPGDLVYGTSKTRNISGGVSKYNILFSACVAFSVKGLGISNQSNLTGNLDIVLDFQRSFGDVAFCVLKGTSSGGPYGKIRNYLGTLYFNDCHVSDFYRGIDSFGGETHIDNSTTFSGNTYDVYANSGLITVGSALSSLNVGRLYGGNVCGTDGWDI
ncbi:MAG: hypothetical protein PVG39_01445 [Desulfobacteraceae bacterium]|jgi:hypothetical protein